MAALEKEVEGGNRGLDTEHKKLDELVRERDILTKLKSQAENASGQQMDLIKINEGTKRNLEQEIQGFKMEAQSKQRLIYQLEKEVEKYGQEASLATSKYMQVRTLYPHSDCDERPLDFSTVGGTQSGRNCSWLSFAAPLLSPR